MSQYKKLVVGIDQSYNRTGISIAADGKLLIVKSIDLHKLQTKAEKRKRIEQTLFTILRNNLHKADEVLVLVERIRTISQGPNKEQGFGLKPEYLKSTGALIGRIVDTAWEFHVPVYSVDTRSWKAKVLGSSKTDAARHKDFEKPEKAEAILFVKRLGFDVSIRDADGNLTWHKRGANADKIYYDDDAADSACIALYGFVKNPNLKLED